MDALRAVCGSKNPEYPVQFPAPVIVCQGSQQGI